MNKIFAGALLTIILILLFWGGCNHIRVGKLEKENAQLKQAPAKPQNTTKVIRDTTTIDSIVFVPVYVPKPVYRDTGSTVFIAKPYAVPGPVQYIDSSKYKGWVAYRDSLAIPLNGGHLILLDTVSNNEIKRAPEWHVRSTTVTEKQTILEKRRQLYIGINGAWAMRDSIMSVGPSLMYLTKRGTAYEAGVHADTKGRIMVTAGAKFLISLRKK